MTMIPGNVARNRLGTGAFQQMQQTPGLVFVPPPVGGWNARDAWAVMPPTDAPLLDNFVIDGGALKVRPGVAAWSDTIAGIGAIPTLHVFSSGATSKLIAIGDDVWDITSSGAPTTIDTQNIAFARSTMAFGLLVIAGISIDGVYTYDGTTFAAATISLSGATQDDLRHPLLFKSRMYFYEERTLSVWYNGTLSAVNGTYSEFDLSQVATLGGQLTAIMRISVQDQGAGADDLFAALTSEGELIVYQGSDPGDASNWSLVGVYFISPPINQTSSVISRSAPAVVGNNVFVITKSGYTSVANAITDPLNINVSTISAKIQPELQSLFETPATGAFKATYDPRHNWLWFSAARSGAIDEMHIYDLNNATWSRFYTNFSVKELRYYEGDMYAVREITGTTYDVRKFTDSAYDDVGTAITCEWITAPTFAGSPLAEKRFTSIELEASSDGPITSVYITTAANFEPPDREASITTENPGTPGSWSLYDYDATEWTNNRPIGRLYKKGCDVMGRSAMARVTMDVRNRPDLRIHGLRWQFEPAAPGAAASY